MSCLPTFLSRRPYCQRVNRRLRPKAALTRSPTPCCRSRFRVFGIFEKIPPLLLPKQVTPFLINFPNVALSEVGSVRMVPSSTLVSASADPVIEIEDQQLNR